MKRKGCLSLILSLVSLGILPLFAQEYPPVTQPVAHPGVGIQRFMQKLANGQTAKLVFFGQSLHSADNAWTTDLADYLRASFPQATLLVENKAIPGCASNCLAPKVSEQLSGTNPDLIIMQDFSVSPASYETLLGNIRKATPGAEALVWNDAVKVAEPKERAYLERWGLDLLPPLLEKYDYALFDIRSGWKQYLLAHFGDPFNAQPLLRDGVHFNDHGQWLAFTLMKGYFVILDDESSASP